MANVMPVHNETISTSTRITKEGRKLTYKLNVIQQPERARACGSGAKSSADRRPVDPPPVVELKIFEGDAMNDITFSYNANFFLFTTLENARPIAQGRVAQTPAASPVLTGMPVSGMAYLDRPTPAGYFLFPDLSVRHEGKYRLGFTLYEEVKEPKDVDAEPASNHPDHPARKVKLGGPKAPKNFVHWRLEVKSKPFTVFSAKKFPGLAESTALSRIVAEQGCRVRIRRDVRMRRRDNKAATDFEEFEEEGAYVRARATPTPDPYPQSTPIARNTPLSDAHDRQRSSSHVNIEVAPAYMDQRTASMHEQAAYTQAQYPQAYPAPPMPAQTPNAYSHLAFGAQPGNFYSAPQYIAPSTQSVAQSPQGYGQPQMQYFGQVVQQVMPPNYQAPQQIPPQHLRQNSTDGSNGSRRNSMSYASVPHPQTYPSQCTPQQGYTYPDSGLVRPQSALQQYPSSAVSAMVPRTPTPGTGTHALPPLKMPMPLEPKYEALSSPVNPSPSSWPVQQQQQQPQPPLPSPSHESSLHRSTSYTQLNGGQTSAPDSTRMSKRPYGSVFETAPLEQPYRNGMRPNEAQTGLDPVPAAYSDEVDGSYEIQQLKMQYKRADGTEISRRLPAVA